MPCSTIRPAYITAMRSAMSATTPRSWVTRITPAWASSRISLISSRIWACTVTSSAVVGSSAISTRGSHENAIAIIARWRMPPENSWGKWRALSAARGMPTRSSSSTACPCASVSEMSSWARICSTIWSPTRSTGFMEVIGSWKIIAISAPRTRRSSSSQASISSRSSP